ncbi:MAG: hypothetical protein ABEJ06_02555 [Haloarculaceae archaeon]
MTDTSDLFELLAARRRRQILFALRRAEALDVPEDLLARDSPRGDGVSRAVQLPSPAGQSRRELEVDLHHRHLPRLAEAGYVEWDRRTGSVSRGPAFAEVEPALRVFVENERAFPDDLW